MTTSTEFRDQLKQLFASQQLAVLATDAGGRPYTSLVAFAATEDQTRLIFATTRATRKFSNLMENPHVSLLIDSRSNQVADFRNAVAVTALGTAAEVVDAERARLLALYLARHPHLASFAKAPSCALLQVSVRQYYLVSRFQNVTVWEILPMKMVYELDGVRAGDERRVGGKNVALARMAAEGMPIPETLCIGVDAYRRYVSLTGLRERIVLELNRKVFEEMRWEEIWDTALRIRHLFIQTPLPDELRSTLAAPIESRFGDRAVVVRSSALGEDAAGASFAGLHDSFVNVRGVDSILSHVRLVWASLWSDRALLYRRELGLSAEASAMGVVVQAIVAGEVSGVAFGISPNEPSQAVIEAVYGLNQGLVDGDVTPDAWILRRDDGAILDHRSPERDKAMRPVKDDAGEGVRLVPLSAEQKIRPPLAPEAVAAVFNMIRKAEAIFGVPQDMEWTFKGGRLFVLQSRPVTTTPQAEGGADNRAWYLSQHRSFENLKQLAARVKDVLLPRMADAATAMAGRDLSPLTDGELAEEIQRREETYATWKKVYWDEFIPLAHGIRLFGQVYNEAVQPRDPFEFVDLLKGADMLSLQRNRMITTMAGMIRKDARLAESLASGATPADGPFMETLRRFMERFGVTAWGAGVVQDRDRVIRMILSLSNLPETGIHDAVAASRRPEDLERDFLAHFTGENRAWAQEMLAVGRESYRLRDDDNIYLGRIEGFMLKAAEEGRRRIASPDTPVHDPAGRSELLKLLERRDAEMTKKKAEARQPGREVALPSDRERGIKARQIVGQPAGPGLARGKARVVTGPDDLFDFASGEILVCDAVDPNMTFLVPLASAVVERRGGMLIHGAIIAREYGLPCVTGVPDAVRFIRTGDDITVDGYLGIVIRHFDLK